MGAVRAARQIVPSCREDSGALFEGVVSRLLDIFERQAANMHGVEAQRGGSALT